MRHLVTITYAAADDLEGFLTLTDDHALQLGVLDLELCHASLEAQTPGRDALIILITEQRRV